MTTQQSVDQAKTEAFLGKVLSDTSGLTTTIMASIGDRRGLFKQLAHAPATSAQLATRAAINERYAREWLGAMASAGYVEYDPASERFTLPAEHLPVLAQESGPIFFGGIHQMLAGMVGPLNQLIQAFQHGGGVPQSAYDHNMWDGLERYTAGWFENLLIPVWVPAMPEVQAKLERGTLVADIGCGRGKALIKLGLAFPRSSSLGRRASAASDACHWRTRSTTFTNSNRSSVAYWSAKLQSNDVGIAFRDIWMSHKPVD